MNQWEEAKKKYDGIPIPEELEKRVQAAIGESAEKRAAAGRLTLTRQTRRWPLGRWTIGGCPAGRSLTGKGLAGRSLAGRGLAAAAAVTLVFTALVNTNTAFAETVNGIPVIGTVARLLTFQSYERAERDYKLTVEVPGVELTGEDAKGLESFVNGQIQAQCGAYAEAAVERAEAYKKAFLDTGGTQEEWEAHQIEIHVWYELKAQSEDYLSFVVHGTENWNSASSGSVYYNLDLRQKKLITLKDLLGEDGIRKAEESVKAQMRQMETEQGITFWEPQEGTAAVSDETSFYINEAGNPVVVFEKYEIAPGSAGEIAFEIERER